MEGPALWGLSFLALLVGLFLGSHWDNGNPLPLYITTSISPTPEPSLKNEEPLIIWKQPVSPFVDVSEWHWYSPGDSNRPLPLSVCITTSLSLHMEPKQFAKPPKNSSDWEKVTAYHKGPYFDTNIELGRLSIENKLLYSHLHQYPFFFYHGFLLDPSKKPTWAKIPVVQHYLRTYEWVMWMDIDAIVMNFTITIEDIITKADKLKRPGQTMDLIIANDGNGLNNGVFLIRQSIWSTEFLQNVMESHDSDMMAYALFHEQSAMEKLLKNPNHNEHTVFVPLRWINSFSEKANKEKDKSIQYQPQDFILHTPGLHPVEKLKEIKKYMNNTIPDIHIIPGGKTNWRILLQDYNIKEKEEKFI